MWRFHGRMLLRVPKALWDASDWWARAVEVALLAGLITPGLSDIVRATLTANLYWITLASFLGLGLFGLLHANYEDFVAAAKRTADAEKVVSCLRSELELIQAARPIIELHDPIPVPDQVLERTHLVDNPSWLSSVSRPPQTRVPRDKVGTFLWRIPVQNSGANADGVFVQIVKVTPDLPSGLAYPTLHVAGDNPQDHERYSLSRSFSLPRGATREIDVIAIQTSQPHKCFIWSVASADAVEEVSLDGSYKFTIRAFAGNAPSEPRDYQVDVDAANGNLTMIALPTRPQEASPTE